MMGKHALPTPAGITADQWTNIKGLPDLPDGRRYFTEIGYSQQYPWAEIRRTAKTVTLAKVRITRDPDWKPEMHPGGFAAHCSNQGQQTWLYESIDPGETRTIRMTKKGWALHDTRYVEGRAVEFYDYNF